MSNRGRESARVRAAVRRLVALAKLQQNLDWFEKRVPNGSFQRSVVGAIKLGDAEKLKKIRAKVKETLLGLVYEKKLHQAKGSAWLANSELIELQNRSILMLRKLHCRLLREIKSIEQEMKVRNN